MKIVNIIKVSVVIGLFSLANQVFAEELQSLKNMERERAQLIQTFIDPRVSPATRQRKIESSQRHLVDLERMVLRDDQLLGLTSRVVRLTFQNYDLSFLVHASAEADHSPIEHWLSQVGLSNDAVLSASVGRR